LKTRYCTDNFSFVTTTETRTKLGVVGFHLRMTHRRKVTLILILLIVLAAHVALFAAGGSWRSAGVALLAVDVISGWFVFAAVREMRKLDKPGD